MPYSVFAATLPHCAHGNHSAQLQCISNYAEFRPILFSSSLSYSAAESAAKNQVEAKNTPAQFQITRGHQKYSFAALFIRDTTYN